MVSGLESPVRSGTIRVMLRAETALTLVEHSMSRRRSVRARESASELSPTALMPARRTSDAVAAPARSSTVSSAEEMMSSTSVKAARDAAGRVLIGRSPRRCRR